MDPLRRTTRRLSGASRGIVALDTPVPELARRLVTAGVGATEAAARTFASMLVRTPTLAQYAGGVVVRPEALDHRVEGVAMAEYVRRSGMTTGVRADTGHEPGVVAEHRVTSGLDGLAERLERYRAAGAQFAVWSICTAALPGDLATLTVNSQSAARFARTCQNAGLVPVVRIGSRMSGAGARARWAALGAATLSLIGHMEDLEVDLDRLVLNAVVPAGVGGGAPWGSPLSVVPPRVGAVALSTALGTAVGTDGPEAGYVGAADDAAVAAALHTAAGRGPWPVTFFVGREATLPALRAWRGATARVPAGQEALVRGLERIAARLPQPTAVVPLRRLALAPRAGE